MCPGRVWKGFKGVSWAFHECFILGFHKYLACVLRVFQECFVFVSSMSQGCVSVLGMFELLL